MVHKKYTYKNGKKFGPYYYENKRVNGKIVTTYLGTKNPEEKNLRRRRTSNIPIRTFAILFGLILVVFGFMFFTNRNILFSPESPETLEVNLLQSSFVVGETLDGNFKFNLVQGELVPINSSVVFSYGGNESIVLLSEIVKLEENEGNFHLRDSKLDGEGRGYGIVGNREIFPEIDFDLVVVSNLSSNEGSGDVGNFENSSSGVSSESNGSRDVNSSKNFESSDNNSDSNNDGVNEGDVSINSTDITKKDKNVPANSEDNSGSQLDVGNGGDKSLGDGGSDGTDVGSGSLNGVDGTSTDNSDSGDSVGTDNSGDLGSSGSEDTGNSNSGGGDLGSTESDSGAELSLSPNGKIISGSVKKGEDFILKLADGESAEIVGGSVKVNGENVNDSVLSIKFSNGEVIISSDYSKIDEGFGEEYLGDLAGSYDFNISNLGFEVVDNGSLIVSYVFEGKDVLFVEKEVMTTESIEENNLSVVTNDSLLNVSLANKTILNVTGNGTNATQFGAILGQPVRWVKKLSVVGGKAERVDLPKSADKVRVRKRDDRGDEVEVEDINSFEDHVENDEVSVPPSSPKPIETGNETNGTGNDIGNFVDNSTDSFTKNESIGNSDNGSLDEGDNVSEITGVLLAPIVANPNLKDIVVNIPSVVSEIDVEYETPAPTLDLEENIGGGKRLHITSPSDIHYTDVLIFTNIDESLNVVNVGDVRVRWIEGAVNIVPSKVEDKNGNGVYDYVEFVAPHLSNQTFDVIVITKANHLDSNRSFISDVYNETKAQDGVWSEAINNGEYVRVTFERALDSSKDISVYPRSVRSCIGNESIVINGKDVPCDIYQKKKRIDEIRRLLNG